VGDVKLISSREASMELRTVNRIPLERLWDEDSEIEAIRERFLSLTTLREMLQKYAVEFYVADIGHLLRRIEVAKCYDFWKSEGRNSHSAMPRSAYIVWFAQFQFGSS
jgi:hypothetical protein